MTKFSNRYLYIKNTDKSKGVSSENTEDVYILRDRFYEGISEADRPLVTVLFLAYNNLEKYTKPAIEAFIKYTSHLDVELVLIDNGSIDGTLDYFKTVEFPRVIICRVSKNIGAIFGNLAAMDAVDRIRFGKYIVSLPNDIIVTKNWLDNLLACMESDERIGMAAPRSNYVSNYQSVDLHYKDLEDMQKKAAEFNVSNSAKWEDRMRVIPTTMIIKCSLWFTYIYDSAFAYYFSDDDLCMQYRRMGYRLVLCGDTFVYHGGSLIVNDSLMNKQLNEGRKIFKEKYYGIDPWLDINNNEFFMCNMLYEGEKKKSNKSHNVLGVDVRCGAPLLTIKNYLSANGEHSFLLEAYTSNSKYWLDLKTICNGEVYTLGYDIKEVYDSILFGEYLNTYSNYIEFLKYILFNLKVGGKAVFKFINYNNSNYRAINFIDLKREISLLSIYTIKKVDISLLEEELPINVYNSLLERCKRGDNDAFDTMLNEFKDSCYYEKYFVGEIKVLIERVI